MNNLLKVLNKFYLNHKWGCGETYETLEWYDEICPKPTQEELDIKYDELIVEEMREERNMLLKKCDYTALPDYPYREKWIQYRQSLRDFPSIWVPGIPFPQPPQE